MKRIGFTGTQRGMTSSQAGYLNMDIRSLVNGEMIEFHHGDCVGADAQAHDIVRDIPADFYIVIHPPEFRAKRAFCKGDEILDELPYLTRNKYIVEQTELLYACPGESEEVIRSGTWSTIRYARKLSVPITIIYPDGRVEKENH